MSKPREFCVLINEPHASMNNRYSIYSCTDKSEQIPDREYLEVIEKSAYDELEARLHGHLTGMREDLDKAWKQADKLAEALDDGLYLYCEDKSTGGCMQCQTCTYIEETIKPALKEYRGEK